MKTRTSTINAGPGLMRKASMNGTVLVPFTRTKPVRRSPPPTHPLKVVDVTTSSTLKVGVIFGMLNSIVPEIGGTAINAGTPPTLTITDTRYVLMEVTVDDDGIATDADIYLSATIPADDDTTGQIVLAYITYTAASGGTPASMVISQSVTHSLRHQMCGSEIHNFWAV